MTDPRTARALDDKVLLALQGVLVGLPLFLGGRHPWGVALAVPTVVLLLGLTVRERRRRHSESPAPGVTALLLFVVLAFLTTVPLPPAVLLVLAPGTAELYGRLLPGWPGGGGWTSWRTLALDPYGVWRELVRLSPGIGVFAVIVAYPWQGDDHGMDGRWRVFGRLTLTLVAGSVLFACLGLLADMAGNGHVLWIAAPRATPGRASGPFVNANHFAAWLELAIPLAIAALVAEIVCVHGLLRRAVESAREAGFSRGRAALAALALHQRGLWAPLAAGVAVLLLTVAHLASRSWGGAAALLLGLGVTGVGMAGRLPSRRFRRWVAAAAILAALAASSATVAAWVAAERAEDAETEVTGPSLASRLAVAGESLDVIRDFPIFGAGLGAWLHAFRPHQAPPVEGGIWDHAHDDYLELAGESGLLGVLAALLFAVTVMRAAGAGRGADGWTSLLRWGLAGGTVAVLAHSLVDFGLRMPGNLLGLMVVLALLVLSAESPDAERHAFVGLRPALALLLVLVAVAGLAPVANAVRILTGGAPLSPQDCLARADRLVAEEGDGAREQAVRLVRRALDQSPVDQDAHVALAAALGPGPEGDAALRRAVARGPWSVELRDRLALRLWDRGERTVAAGELEESMARMPYLVSHAYLVPDAPGLGFGGAGEPIRAVIDGDGMAGRLAALDPAIAGAIERGLARALAMASRGSARAAIADDQVALLEARGRWAEAATALQAEAERSVDPAGKLARAAEDRLRVHDDAAAEQALLAALVRAPGKGELYRRLAVEIYGARGDFPSAENVLRAGQRNALDMLPVYRGLNQMLAQRESARLEPAREARQATDR